MKLYASRILHVQWAPPPRCDVCSSIPHNPCPQILNKLSCLRGLKPCTPHGPVTSRYGVLRTWWKISSKLRRRSRNPFLGGKIWIALRDEMGWLNMLSKANTLYLCRKNNFSWEVQVGTSSPEIHVAIVINTSRLPVGFWWFEYSSMGNYEHQPLGLPEWNHLLGVRLFHQQCPKKQKHGNPKRKIFRDDAEINCVYHGVA